ncbi:DUF2786 domain-containing protein [Sphingobacterium detergens]|uniref:DUF2786 domain-containing protein n=1 Tax=Sphingobacterium detergens TaxID=1145106 RepID=UPI003AAB4050
MENDLLRNKALKRIKALISKTEENGASFEEAKSALEKATQLMKEYFVTINDIEDLKDDPIITEATPLIKIKEHVKEILPMICDLLDLQHFYNKENLTFVGYQTDVKLGIYLYKKLMNGLLSDLNRYRTSEKYKRLNIHYHHNTLRRDFLTGWVYQIGTKVYELLCERERSINNNDKTGIILVKKEKVKAKFAEFDVQTSRQRPQTFFSEEAFHQGVKEADSFNLQNDLDSGVDENLLGIEI